MPQFIYQTTAESMVVDRLVSIFADWMDTTLDSLFNRSGDYTGDPSGSPFPFREDVYLPTPTKVYRQTGPTTQQSQDVGEPSLFVGASGDAVVTGQASNADGFDGIWQVEQPYLATVLFGRGGQKTITDTELGRALREEEHVRLRASYYLGMLVDVVTSRGPAGQSGVDVPEIHTIRPMGRTATQVEMTLNDESYPAFGVAAYEFTVVNFQGFPARNYIVK